MEVVLKNAGNLCKFSRLLWQTWRQSELWETPYHNSELISDWCTVTLHYTTVCLLYLAYDSGGYEVFLITGSPRNEDNRKNSWKSKHNFDMLQFDGIFGKLTPQGQSVVK